MLIDLANFSISVWIRSPQQRMNYDGDKLGKNVHLQKIALFQKKCSKLLQDR